MSAPHLEPATEQLICSPAVIAARLWEYRHLIGQLVRREVALRYRGSYLGVLWSLITPLMMLAIYTLVFSMVFKMRWQSGEHAPALGEVALTLFAGLIPFTIFSETVSRAPGLIISVPNYVKRVVFPLDILPPVVLGAALVNGMISVGVLLAGGAVLMRGVSATLWVFPVMLPLLILLTLGLGWFLASLGTYLRDVGQVVGVALQGAMFLSPIFWPASAAPEVLRPLLRINPLAVIIDGFRRTLLAGQMPEWTPLLVWTGIAAVLAWLGYLWFSYTRRGFADVI